MGLLSWLRSAPKERHNLGGDSGLLNALLGNKAGRDLPGQQDFEDLAEDGYRNNSLVYTCIRIIATSVAEPVLKVLTVDQAADRIITNRASDGDPLARLIARPNMDQDGYEFFEQLITTLFVAGNAFVHKVRSEAGIPVALELIRPDIVGIVQSKNNALTRIGHYVVTIDEKTKKLIPPQDIIHFKLPDAFNELWGLSPLAVIAALGDIDNQAIEYLRAFFFNRGIPSGVLTLDSPVQKPERERIRDMWREQFSGLDGWHNIAVLDAKASYQQLSAGIKDMNLENVTGQTETRICSVFGIPPVIAGTAFALGNSTFSNMEESRRILWLDTLSPLYARLSRRLTASLAEDDFGPNRQIIFDLSQVAALTENRVEIRKIAMQGWNGGLLTRRQTRDMLGLAAPASGEGDDQIKVLPGVMFVPMGTENPLANQETVEPSVTGTESVSPPTPGPDPATVTVKVSAPLRTEILSLIGSVIDEPLVDRLEWQVQHTIADDTYDSWVLIYQGLVERTRAASDSLPLIELLENFDLHSLQRLRLAEGSARDDLVTLMVTTALRLVDQTVDFNPQDEIEFAFDSTAPRLIGGLRTQAEGLLTDMQNDLSFNIAAIAESVQAGLMSAKSGARLIRLAPGLSTKQVEQLSDLDTQLRAQGATIDEAAVALEKAGAAFSGRRQDSLARTQAISVVAQAQHEVHQQLVDVGIVRDGNMKRFWIVTPDDQLDQAICAQIPDMNPSGVGVGEAFQTPIGEIMQPTAHPHCRCSVQLRRI